MEGASGGVPAGAGEEGGGEEHARTESRGYVFMYAAFDGDVRKMRKLVGGLSVAVAKTKYAKGGFGAAGIS